MIQADTLKPRWQIWRFDQMATNVNDRINDPSEADVEYYVGLEHLDPDSLKIRRWGSPSDVEATKLRFCKGDIIFGRRRVYQRKVAVADFDGICSAHALVLRAKPEVVLPEFLPFFMQSDLFMERAKAISVGSLSPTINWKTLAKQEFALPSLEEQKQLYKLFSVSSSNFEALQKAEVSASKCVAAFRENFFSSDICKTIELQNLLSDIEAGKSFTGTDLPPSNGEYAVIKVSAVGSSRFKAKESKVLVNQNEFLPKFSIRAGDLLITRANTPDLVGMSCLVEADYPNLMLSDKTLRLVPKKNISASLLLESLWTSKVRQQLRSSASGTGAAMKNISQEQLRKLTLSWPSQSTDAEVFMSNIHQLRLALTSIQNRYQVAKNYHFQTLNTVLERYQ